MSINPITTRYGRNPTTDLELANKTYVDNFSGDEVIEDYVATGAEASHVFTLPDADDFTNTSEYYLVIAGAITAALAVRVRVNAIATGSYTYDGWRANAGTMTQIDENSSTAGMLASNVILDTAGYLFYIKLSIIWNPAGIQGMCGFISTHAGIGQGSSQSGTGRLSTAITELTSIEIMTDASTWQTGTRITLYRKRRNQTAV